MRHIFFKCKYDHPICQAKLVVHGMYSSPTVALLGLLNTQPFCLGWLHDLEAVKCLEPRYSAQSTRKTAVSEGAEMDAHLLIVGA